MTRCPKALLAAGVIAITATHIGARSGWPVQSTPAVTAEVSSNEFPLFDQGAATMVDAAERAKRLARLLAEAPDSTDTLAALLEAGRPADALRVARPARSTPTRSSSGRTSPRRAAIPSGGSGTPSAAGSTSSTRSGATAWPASKPSRSWSVRGASSSTAGSWKRPWCRSDPPLRSSRIWQRSSKPAPATGAAGSS